MRLDSRKLGTRQYADERRCAHHNASADDTMDMKKWDYGAATTPWLIRGEGGADGMMNLKEQNQYPISFFTMPIHNIIP
jgi:hypothetical protein